MIWTPEAPLPRRLVCGSPEDNITPVILMEKLAARIGCEKKLDFEVGLDFFWLFLLFGVYLRYQLTLVI